MKNRQIRCGVDVQSCPEEGEFKFRIHSLTLPTSFSHQWKWFSYSYMVLNIKHFILFFRTSFRLWLGVVTCQYIPSSSQAEQCSRDSRLWVIDHHWFPWHFQSFRAGAVEGLWAGRGVRSLTNSLKQHAGWFIIVDVPKLAAVTRLLRYWKLVMSTLNPIDQPSLGLHSFSSLMSRGFTWSVGYEAQRSSVFLPLPRHWMTTAANP